MKRLILFVLAGSLFMGCSDPNLEEILQKVSSLLYSTSTMQCNSVDGFTSVSPTVVGDGPYTFSIENIDNPDYVNANNPASAIAINTTSGVVNVAEDNGLPSGEYNLDIGVSNAAGTAVFPKALTIEVEEGVVQFSYNFTSLALDHDESFTSELPTVSSGSTPIEFELVNANELLGFASVDVSSGVIDIDGSQSVVGEYTLEVTATNEFGSTLLEIPLDVYKSVSGLTYSDLISTLDVLDISGYTSITPTVDGSGTIGFSLANSDEVGDFTSVDPSTGVFTIEPKNIKGGEYTITIVAQNAYSSDSVDVSVNILETPNFYGKWHVEAATLVDGDVGRAGEQDLFVRGYSASVIEVGNTQDTPILYGHFLARNLFPNNAYWDNNNQKTFHIEFTNSGEIVSTLNSAPTSSTIGTWRFEPYDGVVYMILEIDFEGNVSQLLYSNVEVSEDGNSWTTDSPNWFIPGDINEPYDLFNLQIFSSKVTFSKYE